MEIKKYGEHNVWRYNPITGEKWISVSYEFIVMNFGYEKEK